MSATALRELPRLVGADHYPKHVDLIGQASKPAPDIRQTWIV